MELATGDDRAARAGGLVRGQGRNPVLMTGNDCDGTGRSRDRYAGSDPSFGVSGLSHHLWLRPTPALASQLGGLVGLYDSTRTVLQSQSLSN